MGTPRPWGSATLGTATAAGGTKGVKEGMAARQGDTGVCREGRVTDEGREMRSKGKKRKCQTTRSRDPDTTEAFRDGISEC